MDTVTADILILARDRATGETWADALAGLGWRIRFGADPPAQPELIDLILTDADGPAGLDGQSLGCGWPGAIQESLVGVVRVGGRGPADARLPADASGRELRLACRLVAEIVRLRRNARARADHVGRLAHEALTDPLTGLPNRRAWDQALQARLQGAARSAGRLCLAVFDLDHFKEVNDTRGHAVGDEVLRATGTAIRAGLREADFVARLGGDEFGLLLQVPNCGAAAAVVDRVRRQLPDRLGQSGVPIVTASAGFHLAPCGGEATRPPSPGALFTAADTALGEAKRRGRDRTVESRAH